MIVGRIKVRREDHKLKSRLKDTFKLRSKPD